MKILLLLESFKNTSSWVLAVVAGLCLGVGIAVPTFGWLVLVGIFFTIKVLYEAKTFRCMLYLAWLAWWVKGLVVMSFFIGVYPITGFPIDNIWQQTGLIFMSWILVSLTLSFGGLVLAVFIYTLKQYQIRQLVLVFLVPLAWLLGELAGSLGYSMVSFGTHSSLGAYFSIGYVGYALVAIPGYIGWAVAGGVYGLTIITALLSTLWYFSNNLYRKKITIGLFILLGLVGYGLLNRIPLSENNPTVLTVDTFFPASSMLREVNFDRATVLAEAVEIAEKYQPDYIILPEDSRFLDSVYSNEDRRQAYALYKFLNSTSSTTVIDSARTAVGDFEDTGVLRSFVFSAQNPPVMSDKRYLTPQGEYLPYFTKLMILLSGNKQALEHPSLGSYITGDLNIPTDFTGPVVLFCYESVIPTMVRNLVQRQDVKPPFVAHPVSQAWFNSTLILPHQIDTMLQVQAVWNQVSIISAGNKAVGKTYSPRGEVAVNTEIARGEGWVVRESKW